MTLNRLQPVYIQEPARHSSNPCNQPPHKEQAIQEYDYKQGNRSDKVIIIERKNNGSSCK